MAPARRETRSRTSSPYSGRPETRSRKGIEPSNAPSTPKAKQASQQHQEPLSRHRYGLRSMLSNLIWGSPVKTVEEQSESGDEVDSNNGDDDDDDGEGGFPPPRKTQQEAHVISDDDDDEEEQGPQTQPSSASTFESAPSRRFTAAEKGKGSPKRADSYSTTKYLPKSSTSTFGGGLRSSQTFGDMRSIQRDTGIMNSIPTSSTPNTSIANEDGGNLPSPGDVNSQLANFFAAKGTASLTAEERRKISELLLGGSASAASSNPNVPTALTPNFSFSVPLPSVSNSNVSILSPAYKGLSRSSTTAGGLSSLASRATGGLSGSQSLSSLSSLANGTGGPASAAANPRSALNRRQARPLYLGAGYSSQAIARRKRVQAQMGGLYSNLTSFDSATPSSAGPAAAATPGKRRRLGEGADTSISVSAVAGSSSNAHDLANAPPTFSIDSTTPLTSTPGPLRTTQQSALFQSAPHLQAQFGRTPVKPSPLRQAAAVATPSPPAKAAEPSPPKTMSKTAGLMRGIVGDTSEPNTKNKSSAAPTPSTSNAASVASPSITMTRSSKPTTRVPREELIKRAEPPSAVEILERSMPPELRATPNGKQARPKPPPVPGSARKTRSAAAADAGKEEGKKTSEQAKENLRVPPARRSKTRSKTPEVASASSAASASESSTSTAPTKLTAGKKTADEPQQTSVSASEDAEMDAAPTQSKPTAFNFSSGAPPTPAPSFFGSGSSKSSAPAVIEQPAPAKPMFAFNPPSQAASASSGSSPASSNPAPPTALKAKDITTKEPAFKAMETTPAAFTLSGTPFDPKQEALNAPSVSLPLFTLYDTGFSLSQANAASEDDAGAKAVKQTVLEIPKNELVVFDLL
ncbi:hypothetical protein P389DRAFT_172691 [Cystobasidium minutum MCA 4210]|uniref:uncharacterized protein n=1 Tax=Cystobasidium minutum MCA 4210 TaxID=1397322 RepID=UPI0034CF69FC|eukprot:jgi/Rhomi1/172691/fgenesh1_kg.5_\